MGGSALPGGPLHTLLINGEAVDVPMDVSLLRVKDGGWCVIRRMPSGEAALRLEALGLRPGKRIQKISGMPFHGPVTVCVDGRQVAIGHGVAARISVDTNLQGGSEEVCL